MKIFILGKIKISKCRLKDLLFSENAIDSKNHLYLASKTQRITK